MKRFPTVLDWALTVPLMIAFVMTGAAKLAGASAMVQTFATIGLGQWLRYVTGVLEVSGGVGLLIPPYRFLAALQLACVMIGATVANLTVLQQPSAALVTVALLALALALAWLRRPQPMRTAGRQMAR